MISWIYFDLLDWTHSVSWMLFARPYLDRAMTSSVVIAVCPIFCSHWAY